MRTWTSSRRGRIHPRRGRRATPRYEALAAGLVISALIGPVMPGSGRAETITMTVLYDNYVHEPGTVADWGFSCLVEGTERTILFDTGYDGAVLLQNITTLQVDVEAIDDIVISHDHLDHTGGLNTVLGLNSDVNVYFGASLPAAFEQNVVAHGATPIRVSGPIEICRDVHSTGELAGPANEQSLLVDTQQGLVVITGCSHPDILQILERALEVTGRDLHLVFGGFHLLNHSTPAIQQIIGSFQAIGVEMAGPTHCTGDAAIQLFQLAYGENFVAIGTGRVLELPAVTAVTDPGTPPGHRAATVLLEPNVPNPFNPDTRIGYALREPAQVRLRVLDVDGRVVRTLEHRWRVAGRHEVSWDGRDDRGGRVSSGVYFYSLTVGDVTRTRAMSLVR